MFQEALEQLILLCLNPYIEGIRLGSLRKGIWSGCLELKELKVKPEVLALLGVPGFRVERGYVKLIRLEIPWSSLATGKVALDISGIHLEVEQMAESRSAEELIQSLREAKQQAVDLRVEQVRNLLEQRRKAEEGMSGADDGFAMKVIRRFINNVRVGIRDISVSFSSQALGIAARVNLPHLAVLSTDKNFKEPVNGEVVTIADDAMYKIMRIEGFSIQLCCGGLACLKNAKYVLQPTGTNLKLAHVPSEGRVFLELDLGAGKLSEVLLLKSQVKQLIQATAALAEEDARLRSLMVPAEVGSAADLMEDALKAEYGQLYTRHLLHERRLAIAGEAPLASDEQRRLQLLEDALPVEILAAQRLASIDLADARKDNQPGFFDFLLGHLACASLDRKSVGMEDLQDATEFESVEAPSTMVAEVRFGDLCAKLQDDSQREAALQELLELFVHSTQLTAKVETAVDYNGKASANINVVGSFGGVDAQHCRQDVIRIRTEACGDCSAAQFAFEHKLEETCNVLSVKLRTSPLDLNFIPSMVPKLLDLVQPPEEAKQATPKSPASPVSPLSRAMSVAAANRTDDVVKQLLGKEGDVAQYADAAYDRVPDQVHFDIIIAAPRVHVPVKDLGGVMMDLGSIKMITPERCSMTAVRMEFTFQDTMLMVATKREEFNVISPLPIDIKLKHDESSDALKADIVITAGDLTLTAAPQALRVLAVLPDVFAELAPPAETTEAMLRTWEEEQAESQVDKGKLAREVAGKSEAVRAAAQRAKELTAKRLQLNLTANLGKLEVAVLDMIHPVLTLQCKMLETVQVNHDSLMTGEDMRTQLSMEKLALVAYARNPLSHEWEPLLEPFHIGASVTLDSVNKGLSTKVSCIAHKPLLLNVAAPSLRRLTQLGPIYAASLGSGEFVEKTRYRALNMYGQPLMLDFHCAHGIRSIELPIGKAVSLEDEILPYAATHIVAWLKGQGEEPMAKSEPFSVESTGSTLVPGSLCVAEMLQPEPGIRFLLLASPLRVHNQCDMPLQLFVSEAQGDLEPGAFSCAGTLLGEASLGYDVQSSMSEEPASMRQPGTYMLMPNEIFAVPADAINKDYVLRTELRMRPAVPGLDLCEIVELSNAEKPDKSFTVSCGKINAEDISLPRLLGSDPAPRGHSKAASRHKTLMEAMEEEAQQTKKQKRGRCLCGSSAGVTEPEQQEEQLGQSAYLQCQNVPNMKVARGVAVSTIMVQPVMQLVNSLPDMEMTIGYKTASSKVLSSMLDRSPWQEVRVPAMSAVNIYDLPGYDLQQGVELRGRLGHDSDTPFSHGVYVRPASISDGGELIDIELCHSASGAAAGFVVHPLGSGKLRISCPRLFTHRLGLQPGEDLELLFNGAPLPRMGDFTMLPSSCESKKCEMVLRQHADSSAHTVKQSVVMPASFDSFDCKHPEGNKYFCIHTEDVAVSSLLGASCKVSTLKPRTVVTNSSDYDLELQVPDGTVEVLEAQQSKPFHWPISTTDKGAADFQLRPLRGGSDVGWSPAIPCSEAAAGSTPMLLSATDAASTPMVWTAEIAPSYSAFSVVLKKGSPFVASNRAKNANVEMSVIPQDADSRPTVVKPGSDAPIAWASPFAERSYAVKVIVGGTEHLISDLRRRFEHTMAHQKVILSVSRVGENTIIALDDTYSVVDAIIERGVSDLSVTSQSDTVFELQVQMPQLGISLVDDHQSHELLFIHLGDMQLNYKTSTTADSEEINFLVGQLQGVCQLPERVDGSTLDHRRHHKAGVLRKEMPAVILANHGERDAHFLNIRIVRQATSSQDLILPVAEVVMDKLDVTVDFDWLSPLLSWLNRAVPEDAIDLGVKWQDVKEQAGRPISINFQPPPLPAIASIESMKLSEINLTVWCRLPLSSLDFLPAPVRTVLRVISVSRYFSLNAASIKLPEKKLPVYRGPVDNLAVTIGMDYAASLLKIVLSLLGKSSLLNGGAIPLALGGTAVSMVTDGVGSTIQKGAGLLEHLAMDEDYHQRQQLYQEQKEIGSAADGFREAGKSLATGMEGALDIFRKPVEGAKNDGAKGCIVGCGTGLAGTLVKPVVGIGTATSDVITGISALATMDSTAKKRRRERCRCRGPRLLYGQPAVLRKWSESDSQLLIQLGSMTDGVLEIVPLAVSMFHRYVMLLFADKLVLAKLQTMHAGFNRHGTTVGLSGKAKSERASHGGHQLDSDFAKMLQPIEEVLQRTRSDGSMHDVPHAELMRGLPFHDIRDARFSDDHEKLILEDRQGNVYEIPLCIETDAKEALLNLLKQAASGNIDWKQFAAVWRPDEQVQEKAIRPKQKDEADAADEMQIISM